MATPVAITSICINAFVVRIFEVMQEV